MRPPCRAPRPDVGKLALKHILFGDGGPTRVAVTSLTSSARRCCDLLGIVKVEHAGGRLAALRARAGDVLRNPKRLGREAAWSRIADTTWR